MTTPKIASVTIAMFKQKSTPSFSFVEQTKDIPPVKPAPSFSFGGQTKKVAIMKKGAQMPLRKTRMWKKRRRQ